MFLRGKFTSQHRFHSDGFGIEYCCSIGERNSKSAEMIQFFSISNDFVWFIFIHSIIFQSCIHLLRRPIFFLFFWKNKNLYMCVRLVWCMFNPKAIYKQFCFALAMMMYVVWYKHSTILLLKYVRTKKEIKINLPLHWSEFWTGSSLDILSISISWSSPFWLSSKWKCSSASSLTL